jgi:sugar lactone lactonase YvrE
MNKDRKHSGGAIIGLQKFFGWSHPEVHRPVRAGAVLLLMNLLLFSTPFRFVSTSRQNTASQEELLPPYSIRPPVGYDVAAVFPAPLAESFDMTFMPSGDLLVVELGLPRISKVNLKGEVSTFALLPYSFSAIAYNAEGELFVGGGEVLKVAADGKLAHFCKTNVNKMALGPDGAFYAIEGGGSPDVKKISPDGQVSTYATGLTFATDIDFSPTGELFVTDPGSQRIVKVGADGALTTAVTGFWKEPGIVVFNQEGQLYYWGEWYDGRSWAGYGLYQVSVLDGSVTPFVTGFYRGAVNDLEIDKYGNIYGIGPTLGVLFKLSPDGRIEFLTDGWYNTRGLAVGPSGDLFIADQGSLSPLRPGQIVRVGMDGGHSVYADGLTAPQSVAFDSSGNLYVGDERVGLWKISPDGKKQVFSEELGLISIAFDPLSGNIFGFQHFFTPDRPTRLLRIAPDGSVSHLPVAFKGEVWDGDLTVDSKGNILLLVTYAENINLGPLFSELFKISPSGEGEVIAKFTQNVTSWTGSVAVGPSGDIYIVDHPGLEESGLEGPSAFVIWKVTPQGEISLFADRLPSDPFSIAINPEGDLFFTCGIGIYKIFPAQGNIVVDGLKNDWEGYSPLVMDAEGDANGRIGDIEAVYGFMDEQYLYLMVDFYQLSKADLDSVNVEADVDGDGRADYLYIFLSDGVTTLVTDLRQSEFSWHRRALSSINEVAEVRLPLSYVGNRRDFSFQVAAIGKSGGGNSPEDRSAFASMTAPAVAQLSTPIPTPASTPTPPPSPTPSIPLGAAVIFGVVIIAAVGTVGYILGKRAKGK